MKSSHTIRIVKAAQQIGLRGGLGARELLYKAARLYYSSFVISSDDRAALASNRPFQGMYSGRRAVIIGNGPSLKHLNLGRLRNELNFVVNGFWRHPVLSEWQPTAIGLADPSYFAKPNFYAEEFAGLRTAVKEGKFFCPLEARPIVESGALLPLERTFYFAPFGSVGHVRDIAVDFTKCIPGVQTVPIYMMMLALYMGCNPIYLIGMDCDFLASPSQATHFYSDDSHPPDPDSYIFWTYDNIMRAVLKMWEGYIAVGRYAQSRGTQIFNAGQGGFLDVFPRVSFEAVFS